MAFFYEIRSTDNTVLKRDGGFATQDAAKTAGRDDAKKMKTTRLRQGYGGQARQPPACPAGRDTPDVERILVGQNAENATQ
jgi:hypothetical protein